ncbi:Hypothetical predicted protein, partial [Marmota monax]
MQDLWSALAESPINTPADRQDSLHSHAGHSIAIYPQYNAIAWLPPPHQTLSTSPDTPVLKADRHHLGSTFLHLAGVIPRSDLQQPGTRFPPSPAAKPNTVAALHRCAVLPGSCPREHR